jgi:carbon-monoxide dehydrogenase medium subunit
MVRWNNYHRAESLQDALEALTGSPGPALPVAGGTDLLLDIQQGRHAPVNTLVDVTAIPELASIHEAPDRLLIGASVPLSRLVGHPGLQEHAQALVEACDLIGGPQVRNTASLGGNVAHALPAGDGTIALFALDAEAQVALLDSNGKLVLRWAPIAELFRGPGKSSLDLSAELIVCFSIRRRKPGEASAFIRVMRPQGVALPILNLAAWLRRDGDLVSDVRIVVGPSGPVPRRASQAEASLRSGPLTDGTLSAALEALLEESHFRTSPQRGSAEYRRELAGTLLHDGLRIAWDRAISG